MEEAERIRMIEELTEDEMYHVGYMDAMNMVFNMMATQFETLDDESLKSRYLSRFSNNTEVH